MTDAERNARRMGYDPPEENDAELGEQIINRRLAEIKQEEERAVVEAVAKWLLEPEKDDSWATPSASLERSVAARAKQLLAAYRAGKITIG